MAGGAYVTVGLKPVPEHWTQAHKTIRVGHVVVYLSGCCCVVLV